VLLQPRADADADQGRLLWVLELFERLERRSATLRSSSSDASA